MCHAKDTKSGKALALPTNGFLRRKCDEKHRSDDKTRWKMQSIKFCGGSKSLCLMRDTVLEIDFTEWKDFTKEGGRWKNDSRGWD